MLDGPTGQTVYCFAPILLCTQTPQEFRQIRALVGIAAVERVRGGSATLSIEKIIETRNGVVVEEDRLPRQIE